MPGLCAGCGRLREDLRDCRECRECREADRVTAALADFLLRFDRMTPKIPTPVNPEYREWVAWAKERAEGSAEDQILPLKEQAAPAR